MTSAVNVAKMLPTDLFERAPNGDKRPILAIKWHHGEMAERTKAPVSKTGIPPGIVGSNPTLSARFSLVPACWRHLTA